MVVSSPWTAIAFALLFGAPVESGPSVDHAPLPWTRPPAWIVLGGGYDPLSNQVSIAQDLHLAGSILAGDGITLFAGGAHSPVAVLRESTWSDELAERLEELFGTPEATTVRFQPAGWRPDGPATAAHVLDAIERALQQGSEPLFVYAAGHGEGGSAPAESTLNLWGGWSIMAEDLGEILDSPATRRPLRLVVTSCFGGGFGDIVNHGPAALDEEGRTVFAASGALPETLVHCGVFAAPWDEESSGCDPDPDRRNQESYSIHFLRALAGQDRSGQPLPLEDLDYDRDGRIGLLDAHTRARIFSRSIDNPTTTSESWLRQHFETAPAVGDPELAWLPEERAVLAALGPELGLESSTAASRRLGDLDARLADLVRLVDETQLDADDAYYALRITLLERWPQLSHAWDPATRELLGRERESISEVAVRSAPAQRYREAMIRLDRRLAAYERLVLKRAAVARLDRAWQTLAMAAALHENGGPSWDRYLDLLRCERWAP